MRALPLLLTLLADPALAQEAPNWSVTADLDRDGRPETYTLMENRYGTVDLVIESVAGRATVERVAWTGGMAGQEPDLALSPAGSVWLTSRNDSIGRDRWTARLTIAFRDGALRIAGITYDRLDTLEPETGWGGCDVNLLTGRGERTGPAGTVGMDLPLPAPSLWDWDETELAQILPAECFG